MKASPGTRALGRNSGVRSHLPNLKLKPGKRLHRVAVDRKGETRLNMGASWVMNILVFSMLAIPPAWTQQVTIEAVKTVQTSGSRWYPDFQIQADPSNPRSLLICGGKWETGENVLSGVVYASSDGGHVWDQSIEDRSSSFVSEHSCAFGADGKAYFVSGASKVIDGVLHHDLGTTRIFSSNDSGRTWAQVAQTVWADSPLSVVNTGAGLLHNRLFTFFNQSDSDPKNHLTRLGLLTFRMDEPAVTGPIPDSKTGSYEYRGSFPHAAVVLKDDSIVVLYRATLNTSDPTELAIGVVHFFPGQTVLPDRVHAVHVVLSTEHSCFIDEADAFDPHRDRIWIAYHEFADGSCKFMLTSSNDYGRTWSKPSEISPPSTLSKSYHNPAMALNSDGTLGLLWRDTENSDCWYFAASTNEGRTFTVAQPLSSSCLSRAAQESPDAFLMTEVKQSDSSRPSFGPTLSVINHLNGVWQFASPLIASADDLFHPVWIEVNAGQGELKTTTVRVECVRSVHEGALPDKASSRDIGSQVALLYGGGQYYDSQEGIFNLKMVLRNKTDTPIYSPIYLQAVSLKSDVGPVEIMDADNGETGAGAVWALTDALPQGVLEPSSTTKPFWFSFHVSRKAGSRLETPFELVTMQLKVLAHANP